MTSPDTLTCDQLKERYNRILFGAPGTGKSYFLQENSKKFFDENNIERVTFYPRYSYGQFVGMYKPVPAGIGVTYKYVPGPFMRTYVKAKMAYDNYDAYKKDIDAYKKDINDSNTKFFLFPTDPDTWYLFEKVTANFTEESFDATYRMKKNDIALIYVADKGDHKNQGKKPGIYAIGRIITDVKVNGTKSNGRKDKEVTLRFDKVFEEPIIDYEEMKNANSDSDIETILDNTDDNNNKVEEKKVFINVRSCREITGKLKEKVVEKLKVKYLKELDKEFKNSNNYLLIIEEINRANAAAVFGDVFQLLDRNEKGESSYPIVTSEDARDYLAHEFYGRNYDDCTQEQKKECETMQIPSNMYIWATMNSADQGVEILDTAFKRRWEFEYIEINESESAVDDYFIPVHINKDSKKIKIVKWNALRKKINDALSDCYVKEDKLLGPFFLSKERLKSVASIKDKNGNETLSEKNAKEFIEAFKSKVLMYLFEDAAAGNIDGIFKNKPMRYSTVCDSFNKVGIGIFNFKEDLKDNEKKEVDLI